ncbi:MAG: aspartate kinase [Bacteroidota bacterium]|nr:aspartate kinase [Bacteroidota bacterium]
MKIFKFGGASVKDAEGVRNVCRIFKQTQEKNLVIIVSAMGKTTNHLEGIVESYFSNSPTSLDKIKSFHLAIIDQLFEPNHAIFDQVNNLFVEIEWAIENSPSQNYDFEYDQIVSVGELLSTKIISAYLLQEGVSNQWLDARDLVRTDNTYRQARIDWAKTTLNINEYIQSNGLYITQGFIGCTSENFSTTLGREGSDFSAAIMAFALEAKEVVIWKDVDGMLNADPRFFEDAKLLSRLSFSEAIELAYYGAKVIHPKTIQPLKEKNITLKVKSFLNPENEGTIIYENIKMLPHLPSFILKEKQILISISASDLSFIVEDHLSHIFSLLSSHNVSVNMMQNSAVSFSICADDDSHKIPLLLSELKTKYKLKYNRQLTLCTIRHYSQGDIQRVIGEKRILLEQKTGKTVQFVY